MIIDLNFSPTTHIHQYNEYNKQNQHTLQIPVFLPTAVDEEYPDDAIIEVDESGKLRLKRGKKLDLSKISDDMLRKLGIDPNLTAKEKAKLLKVRVLDHLGPFVPLFRHI